MICSVITMVPHKITLPGLPGRGVEERWFVVEKPGLEAAEMGGVVENSRDDTELMYED
jgi:hypothetical protein